MNTQVSIATKPLVYSAFRYINNKVYNALAEYVDNSIASFLHHKDLLTKLNPKGKLSVYITIDVDNDTIIIEDNAFIGGNCGIYEGTIIRERAVIGTGVIINASTSIYDAVHGNWIKANENGQITVPPGAVVVAGSRPVCKGPGKEEGIHLYCPVIVKYRDEKTDASVSLEEFLR